MSNPVWRLQLEFTFSGKSLLFLPDKKWCWHVAYNSPLSFTTFVCFLTELRHSMGIFILVSLIKGNVGQIKKKMLELKPTRKFHQSYFFFLSLSHILWSSQSEVICSNKYLKSSYSCLWGFADWFAHLKSSTVIRGIKY